MNLVKRYQELSRQMLTGLLNKDVVAVMTGIEGRQRIIDNVASGDPFGPPQNLLAVLKQISAIDKKCIRICRSDLDVLKTELLNERRKRQGLQGYGVAHDRPTARFIDHKVE